MVAGNAYCKEVIQKVLSHYPDNTLKPVWLPLLSRMSKLCLTQYFFKVSKPSQKVFVNAPQFIHLHSETWWQSILKFIMLSYFPESGQ
jgi:hypothetical protein